jgi:TctA family transporter
MLSGGSLAVFVTRPIACFFVAVALLAYLSPLLRWGLRRWRVRAAGVSAA